MEAVRDITSGKMATVVVECTGTAPGMNMALDLARPLGRVSLPGLPHAGQQLPLLMEKVVEGVYPERRLWYDSPTRVFTSGIYWRM